MVIPKPGEGVYICENCKASITFPTEQNGKIVKPGSLLNKPVCPNCGGRKFKRDPRVVY